MNEVERCEHAGKIIKIYYDEDPPNPREDFEHISIMVYWHRRNVVGDKRVSEPMTEEEVREAYPGILAILPVYLYQHSGMTIATTPFTCSFDSGQVGWAFVTKESALEMGFTDTSKTPIEDMIRQDVAEYDQYLKGDIYGYVIENADGDDLDSCWGFYGLENVRGEAKNAAEGAHDPAVDRAAEELQARATFAGIA